MRIRLLLIAFGLSLILGFGAVWLAGRWHPGDADYPRQGIDVSHHQGAIDWPRLPAQGVDFAYIKATEGGDHRDRLFAANWSGAGQAGIARGAYHFFTLCRPGVEQAANFIATVPNDPAALPPAVDLEFMGNCGRPLPPTRLRAELAQFLTVIEAHYRKPAILYLTEEFDRTYAISAAAQRPLWLRSIVAKPKFTARPWRIWQASNFRRLDGIVGRVDWNVMAP
jgi:lysozyme